MIRGVSVLASSLEQHRKVEHCVCVVRRDPQRCAQGFDGGFAASLLVEQVAEIVPSLRECWIDTRCGPQCHFGFDIAAVGSEHVTEIERCRCIHWIAFHKNAVKAFGFGNITSLLSRLGLLKQVIRIVPGLVDCEHKLAVFVGASPGLFDFQAVARSGMEPHICQANIRQPFPDFAHAAGDFAKSNAVADVATR